MVEARRREGRASLIFRQRQRVAPAFGLGSPTFFFIFFTHIYIRNRIGSKISYFYRPINTKKVQVKERESKEREERERREKTEREKREYISLKTEPDTPRVRESDFCSQKVQVGERNPKKRLYTASACTCHTSRHRAPIREVVLRLSSPPFRPAGESPKRRKTAQVCRKPTKTGNKRANAQKKGRKVGEWVGFSAHFRHMLTPWSP